MSDWTSPESAPAASGFSNTWEVLPGVELVMSGAFGVTAVFYMLDEMAVRPWVAAEIALARERTRLAFTVGVA